MKRGKLIKWLTVSPGKSGLLFNLGYALNTGIRHLKSQRRGEEGRVWIVF